MKNKRIAPDAPLGEPVRKFKDTFSAETAVAEMFRFFKICEGCGKDRADPPSKLCLGCQAYREHQQ